MNAITREVLQSLSITGNYRGFLYTVIACELIYDNETKLHNVTQDIYCEIAEICGCRVHTVERNIRTIIFHAWQEQRERLCEIAGVTLTAPPSVSEFLSIISNYVRLKTKRTTVRIQRYSAYPQSFFQNDNSPDKWSLQAQKTLLPFE